MNLGNQTVATCPIDHTTTELVDGFEVCKQGHKWVPTNGVFKLVAPKSPLFVAVRRTVVYAKKEVCRAASLDWAKRISRALNQQERESR
jgi:hypothetical protein